MTKFLKNLVRFAVRLALKSMPAKLRQYVFGQLLLLGGPYGTLPDYNPNSLVEIQVPVMGRTIGLLVRNATMDAGIVAEVCVGYAIEDLVQRLQARERVTIIDIGGHIGSFSVIMAQLLPQSRIDIYEIVPDNVRVIELNILCNRLADRVKVHNVGVAGRPGFLSLDRIGINPSNTGGHSIAGALSGPLTAGRPENSVELVSFGSLLDGIDHVDLLKIDCEGSEFDILFNATPAQMAKIEAIVGEVHSSDGLAAVKTQGWEWTSGGLQRFLGQYYAAVEAHGGGRTATGNLENFTATLPRTGQALGAHSRSG